MAHLAMRIDRPDAHNTRRPQQLAKQRSPGPPVQESELGHREARGRFSETAGKRLRNEAVGPQKKCTALQKHSLSSSEGDK